MKLPNLRMLPIIVLAASLLILKIKFGLSVLNPFHAVWALIRGSDICDQYLAWEFYRASAWGFPLGMIQNYPYPLESNICFIDGIPVFAILFKPVAQLFSGDFQYFGWWYLLCFFLMGISANGLLRSMGVENKSYRLVATLFFVFSPILIYRTGHPALCAQWMIVAGFWIYFDKKYSDRKKDLAIIVLSVLSIMSHPYLMPMIYGIGVAHWAKESFYVNKKHWLNFTIKSFLCGAAIIMTMWIVGFFSIDSTEVGRGGFGYFSANLNTLFNSFGRSNILPALPVVNAGQLGGFAYLGISIIILFIAWLVSKLVYTSKAKPPRMTWPLLIMVGGMALYSLSNAWSINEYVFLKFTLPEFITKPFRVSGRYIWPLYYLIFAGMLRWFSNINWRDKPKLICLSLLLALQIADVEGLLHNKYIKHEYKHPLKSEVWKDIYSASQKIIMYPPFRGTYLREHDRMHFVYHAHKYQRQISTGRIVYKDNKVLRDFKKRLEQNLAKASLEGFERDAFVTTTKHLDKFKPLLVEKKVKGFRADGYLIFIPLPLIWEKEVLQDLPVESLEDLSSVD